MPARQTWHDLPTSFLSLLGETEPGRAGGHGVDDVLALEEDVTQDVETNVVGRLDATKARAVAVGGKVDVVSGNGLLDATNDNGEVGQGGGAGEDITSIVGRVLGTTNLGVVGVDDGVVEVDEGGAGVGNSTEAVTGGGSASDSVAAGGELPETLASVYVGVGNGTGVFA